MFKHNTLHHACAYTRLDYFSRHRQRETVIETLEHIRRKRENT